METIMVKVNGRAYPTELVNGVQRFVSDPAVEELVKLALEHFRGPASGQNAINFYALIPASLKTLTHSSPVVNYMVQRNETEYCGLNELALALHASAFTFQEYVEFSTLHGGSVSWFMDAMESQASNLDLGELYYDEEDAEYYEDFSAVLEVENPLW